MIPTNCSRCDKSCCPYNISWINPLGPKPNNISWINPLGPKPITDPPYDFSLLSHDFDGGKNVMSPDFKTYTKICKKCGMSEIFSKTEKMYGLCGVNFIDLKRK